MWRRARLVLSTLLLVVGAAFWRQTASPAEQTPAPVVSPLTQPEPALSAQVWVDSTQNTVSSTGASNSIAPALDDLTTAWAAYGDQTSECICKSSPAGTLQPRAFHSRTVVSAVVSNISSHPVKLKLQTVLPAGTYTIDQLSFVPNASTPAGSQSPQVQRLQGTVLRRTGKVTKWVDLQPGQISVYRFVNRAGRAIQSFRELLAALHQLAIHHPAIARPMRRALLHDHEDLLRLAYGHSHEGRLRAMHSVLLAGAQAESLELNMTAHHPHARVAARSVRHTMTAYMDNVARVGAVLLGLVPQITTTVDHNGVSVNIALENTGSRSVYGVKLAVHTSSLPDGVKPTPGDADYFGVLRPGQSAASVFKLTCASNRPDQVAADVSYIAGGGPAQLLPLSWHITYPAAQKTASTSTR